jgi:hypothetical protein
MRRQMSDTVPRFAIVIRRVAPSWYVWAAICPPTDGSSSEAQGPSSLLGAGALLLARVADDGLRRWLFSKRLALSRTRLHKSDAPLRHVEARRPSWSRGFGKPERTCRLPVRGCGASPGEPWCRRSLRRSADGTVRTPARRHRPEGRMRQRERQALFSKNAVKVVRPRRNCHPATWQR